MADTRQPALHQVKDSISLYLFVYILQEATCSLISMLCSLPRYAYTPTTALKLDKESKHSTHVSVVHSTPLFM